MESQQPTFFQRLMAVIAYNPQRQFGSYAAELSFYIIWALIPMMLAFANVIAILPFSTNEIVSVIEQALPSQVSAGVMPILESYINQTSASALSIGLIISLWPASNVFNTVQRIVNKIFKATSARNAFLARAFAYVFTLALVLVLFSLGLVFIFGEAILSYLGDVFNLQLPFLDSILSQSGLIGIIGIFCLMFAIYYFMPNKNWPARYAAIGAGVATAGFVAISQLFTVYLSFNKNVDSNTAIGLFIVVIIWLYFNMMVIAAGAYVAVIAHDFSERDYYEIKAEMEKPQHFVLKSPDFVDYPKRRMNLQIFNQTNQNDQEGMMTWQEPNV